MKNNCTIKTNAEGKVTKVNDANGTDSKLFKAIAEHPLVKDTNEALDLFKNKFSKKIEETKKVVAGNKLFNQPLKEAATIADSYMKKAGLNRPKVVQIKNINKTRAVKIAEEFEKMEETPNDPLTRAAYDKMVEETLAQYESIIEKGYKVEVNNEEPYSSSGEMIEDLRKNKNMKIFSTQSGFGSSVITDEQRQNNPLLQKTKYKDKNGVPLLANDVFRFVHDFFGHAELGNSFGPVGEENAWNVHIRMYSPLAARAVTTETRGQNSWVNFSGVNDEAFKLRDKARQLRKEGRYREAKELSNQVYDMMEFAPQKVGLLPEWVADPDGKPTLTGGAAFAQFFAEVTNTKDGGAKVESVSEVLQKPVDGYENELTAYLKYGKNFQKHIMASIPGFVDARIRALKGMVNAAKLLGKNNSEVAMLDITSSEGYYTKAWAQLAQDRNINATADALDAGVTFQRDFNEAPQVKGVKYLLEAWGEGFTDPDTGTEIPLFVPSKKYKVVFEGMGFQFFTPTRDKEISEVKDLMDKDGLFVTMQKFKNPDYAEREVMKDEYKSKFFTKTQLEKKAATVLFKSDESSVGMADYQVDRLAYEKILKDKFKYVVQIYSSGNFAGYAATDNLEVMNTTLDGIGDTTTQFNMEPTPGVIKGDDTINEKVYEINRETSMEGGPKFQIQDSLDSDSNINNGLPLTKAPNGNPSILYQSYKDLGYTDAQAESLTRQVYTPEFKAWFGDWENDPKNASKVVDEKGMPMVVYHGTDTNFTEFKRDRVGVSSGEVSRDNGFYFSESKEVAKEFAKEYSYGDTNLINVIPAFIKVKTPREVNASDKNFNQFSFLEGIQGSKNDGALFTNYIEYGILSNQYMVLNPNQIKSATENVGDFSQENNDIRYQVEENQTTAKEVALEEVVKQLEKTGLADEVLVLSNSEIQQKISEFGESKVTKTVNGFVHNNKVYLNKDAVTAETAIHEFHHLYNQYLKQTNPVLYKKGLDLIEAEIAKPTVVISKSKSENPSFDSMLDFNVSGGVLEIGRIKGRDIYSILHLKVDENFRRQGLASKLLKEALNKTNGNLSGQASNDAAIGLNYKLGMRAYKNEKELSLEESKSERAKSAGESIRMILPENMRGENYKPFVTDNSQIQDIIAYVERTQPNLKGDAKVEEILTQLLGQKGIELINSKKKSGIVDWLKQVWEDIKNMLGLNDYTVEQVLNMNLEEYAVARNVSILKGESIRTQPTSDYAITTKEEKYFIRNADRLPLTLAVFNRPNFVKMRGKKVNPITILNSLNQSGIKQIEKDLIKQIIEDNYQGQKRVSYDELEATVRANIIPLERIFTSSFAGYGMDNLGDGDYGDAKTILLNSPIEHGVEGHFSGDFNSSGRKNIKYVTKQLKDNVWVAVEEGYESQANDNNIYQFVGTAGTKEAVDAWIIKYNLSQGKIFDNKKYLIYQDAYDQTDNVIPLVGVNTEQEAKDYIEQNRDKYSYNLDYVDEQYLKDKWNLENINKGMFAHIRVWEKRERDFNLRDERDKFDRDMYQKYGDMWEDKLSPEEKAKSRDFIKRINQENQVFYVAELQSDYFQKNNAKKDITEKVDITDFNLETNTEFNKLDNAEQEKAVKKLKSIGFTLESKEAEGGIGRLYSIYKGNKLITKEFRSGVNADYYAVMLRAVGDFNRGILEVEDINSFEEVIKVVESKEKVVGNFLKNRINEASKIKEQKLSLKEKQFIASQKSWEQRTVREAIKEAALNGATSLRFPTPYTLSVIEGYIRLEEEDVAKKDLRKAQDGEIVNYLGEEYIVMYSEIPNGGSNVQIARLDDLAKITYAEFTEMEDNEGLPDTYVESSDGEFVYYTNSIYNVTETINIEDRTSSKEDFSVETDLSEIEQTVARKYEEIAEILKQERGEGNVEIITDKNGFDWYETKIDSTDLNQPVIAFSISDTNNPEKESQAEVEEVIIQLNKAFPSVEVSTDWKEFEKSNPSDARNQIGKRARETYEKIIRSRNSNISEEHLKQSLNFLHSLEESKENTKAIKIAVKWLTTDSVRFPESIENVRTAIELASKNKVDPMQFKSPMDIINKYYVEIEYGKAVNPDSLKGFSNKRTLGEGDNQVTIYDVDEGPAGQAAVVKVSHNAFGWSNSAKNSKQPWCLAGFTRAGKITESAKNFWENTYNSVGKKIAFKEGKPIAFMAHSEGYEGDLWWDLKDEPTNNLPLPNGEYLSEEGDIEEAKRPLSAEEIYPEQDDYEAAEESVRSGLDNSDYIDMISHLYDYPSNRYSTVTSNILNEIEEEIEGFIKTKMEDYVIGQLEDGKYKEEIEKYLKDNGYTTEQIEAEDYEIDQNAYEEIAEYIVENYKKYEQLVEEREGIKQDETESSISTYVLSRAEEVEIWSDYYSTDQGRMDYQDEVFDIAYDYAYEYAQEGTGEFEDLSYLKNEDGEIYGAVTKEGKVYLNPNKMNMETPIHEFHHIYNQYLKKNSPELYNKGIRLIEAEIKKGDKSEIKDIIAFVERAQPDLKGEAKLEEILTQLLGERGVELINSKRKNGLIDWLKDVWNEIKRMMGLSDFTLEEVLSMNLEEYVRARNVDLLRGEELSSQESDSNVKAPQTETESEIEPELVHKVNNKIYKSYKDALANSNEGDVIEIGMESFGVFNPVMTTRRNTNKNTEQGFINNLILNGYLNESKTKVNFEYNYQAAGETPLAKAINIAYILEETPAYFGTQGIKRDGSTFKLNKTIGKVKVVNKKGEVETVDKSEIDSKTFEELSELYDNPVELITQREWAATKVAYREESVENLDQEPAVSAGELELSLLNFLNKIGVSVMSINEYVKKYKLRHGVSPSAKALADIANQVVAYVKGDTDSLAEEVAHFINEAFPQDQIENILRNIHKTAEWAEFYEVYKNIYSKEYSGAELDNVIRREILGKVVAKVVANTFQRNNTTETQKNIFQKVAELVSDFFTSLRNKFRPQYEQELNSYLNQVEALLTAEDVSDYIDVNNFKDNKIRLYNVGNTANTTNRLRGTTTALARQLELTESKLIRGGSGNKLNKGNLERINSQLETAVTKEAVLSLVSMVNANVKALNAAVRDSKVNNKSYFLSDEEAIVYQTTKEVSIKAISEIKVLLKEDQENNKTKEWDSTISEIDNALLGAKELIAQASLIDSQNIEKLVEKILRDYNISEAEADSVRKWIEKAESDTNVFHATFGQLLHAKDGMLNLAGKLLKDMSSEGALEYYMATKDFQDKLKELGVSEADISQFFDGQFILSEYDFNEFTKQSNEIFANTYKETITKSINDKNTEASRRTILEGLLKLDNEELINLRDLKELEPLNSKEDSYRKNLERPLLTPLIERTMNDSYYEQYDKMIKDLNINDITKQRLSEYLGAISALKKKAYRKEGTTLVLDYNSLSEADKENLSNLHEQRNKMKSYTDEEGMLKPGLSYVIKEGKIQKDKDTGKPIITIGNPNQLTDDSLVALDLNKMDNYLREENKKKGIPPQQSAKLFYDTINRIDNEESREAALKFLEQNAFISLSQDFWDNLSIGGNIIESLETLKDVSPELSTEINIIINDIELATFKIKNIIKLYKRKNNPSEVEVENMSETAIKAVKNLQQESLQVSMRKARLILKKNGVDLPGFTEAPEGFLSGVSEVNGAYGKKLRALDIEENFNDSIDEDTRKINEEIDFAKNHMTDENASNIENYRIKIRDYTAGLISGVPKGIESQLERLGYEIEDLRDPVIANKVLRTLTRNSVLPYYKRYTSEGYTNFEKGLQTTDDLANYLQYSQKAKNAFVEINPNPTFFDVQENKEINPNYKKEFKGGYLQPKLSIFKNKKFEDLFGTIVNGESTKNPKLYKAYLVTMEYNDKTLEAMSMGESYNNYIPPQTRKAGVQRFSTLLKGDVRSNVKNLIKDSFSYTEDDMIQGEKIYGTDLKTIPKMYVNRLENPEDVSTELFYSLTLRAKEAFARKSKVKYYGDIMSVYDKIGTREMAKGKDPQSSQTYRMVTSAIDYGVFGIKEAVTYPVNTPIGTIDLTKVARSILNFIKFRNLGANVIIPITSLISGGVTRKMEAIVGEFLDTRSQALGAREFTRIGGSGAKEIGVVNTEAKLNVLGQFFGAFDINESFKNSNYGWLARFLPRMGMMLHSASNYPLYGKTMLGVLHDYRVIEGVMMNKVEYMRVKKDQGVNVKDAEAEWGKHENTVMYKYLIHDKNKVTWDREALSKVLTKEGLPLTEEELDATIDVNYKKAQRYLSLINSLVDGQLPEADKVLAQRHYLYNYFMTHRGWLTIQLARRFKDRHLNLDTGLIEEGSYRSLFSYLGGVFKEARDSNTKNFMKAFKTRWQNADEIERKNMRRVVVEISGLAALMSLGLLLRYAAEDDDNEDLFLLQLTNLLAYRTLNELSSAQFNITSNMFEAAESPFVGLQTIQNMKDITHILSGDEVKQGVYKGMTERRRFFTKMVPGMKQYHDLQNMHQTYDTYKFYNKRNFSLTPAYFLWMNTIDKKKED